MAATTTSYGRARGDGGWHRGDAMAATSVAWTTDASGDASVTVSDFDGLIRRVVAAPGAAADQPTDQYDITVVDDDSVNITVPELNASNAAAHDLTLTRCPFGHYGTVTVTIANGGNAKSGEVILYWSPT